MLFIYLFIYLRLSFIYLFICNLSLTAVPLSPSASCSICYLWAEMGFKQMLIVIMKCVCNIKTLNILKAIRELFAL